MELKCPLLAAGTTHKCNVMIGGPQFSHFYVLSERHSTGEIECDVMMLVCGECGP